MLGIVAGANKRHRKSSAKHSFLIIFSGVSEFVAPEVDDRDNDSTLLSILWLSDAFHVDFLPSQFVRKHLRNDLKGFELSAGSHSFWPLTNLFFDLGIA